MSYAPATNADSPDDATHVFLSVRPRLFGIAYRISSPLSSSRSSTAEASSELPASLSSAASAGEAMDAA